MLSPLGLDGGRQNVLVTSGSMQGIDLIARIFVDPGDTVLVESPSFLGALQTFNLYQANLVPVEMDGHGVIIERLEELMKLHRPKLFYCIPTFQNPTGKTLPEDRRRAVAELAKKYDVIVIEDDPYRELRYRGEPLKAIKSFDSAGQVVLLNSFSKTLSPGIRVGCAFGRQDIIRKMTIAKQSARYAYVKPYPGHSSRVSRAGLYAAASERDNTRLRRAYGGHANRNGRVFPRGVRLYPPRGRSVHLG